MTTIPVYQVDSGVPIPESRSSLPLEQLNVGESFLFPIEKRRSVQTLTSRLKRETGKEYTIKKMDDKHCRVWRIN